MGLYCVELHWGVFQFRLKASTAADPIMRRDCMETAPSSPVAAHKHFTVLPDIHPFMHTPTAAAATQGDSQLVRSCQGEDVSLSGTPRHSDRRSYGIELATSRIPVNKLHLLLSHGPPFFINMSRQVVVNDVTRINVIYL